MKRVLLPALLFAALLGACRSTQPASAVAGAELTQQIADSVVAERLRRSAVQGAASMISAAGMALELDSVSLTLSARHLRLGGTQIFGAAADALSGGSDSLALSAAASGKSEAKTQAAAAAPVISDEGHGCRRWRYAALGAAAVLLILSVWKLRKPLKRLFSCLGL